MEGFRLQVELGNYKDALDMVPIDHLFRNGHESFDVLTALCTYTRKDDVQLIQMVLDRGFDLNDIRFNSTRALNLWECGKRKITERLLALLETNKKSPAVFAALFEQVTFNGYAMFRLWIFMFGFGARPDWLRCHDYFRYLKIADIYNQYENVRNTSIALFRIRKAPKDVMRIISRLLWSTRADERWYKLK